MYTSNPETNSNSRFNEYPWLAPRCWHGMSISRWFQFLRENDFRFDRNPMAIGASLLATINSFLNRIQTLLFLRAARNTPRDQDPVFIIGHWRTGTTFLQYLLGRDERFHTPDTFECMSPDHFLVSRVTSKIMTCPSRRPMDNIPLGWQKPQEDEFALCVRGATSVYRHFGFPREEYRHIDSLTLDDSTDEQRAHWKSTLNRFVTFLNYGHRKPLILKSPTHTGRIHVLLDMFPNAKFIHITRDPIDFIPSTMYLWQSLEATSGLQWKVDHIDHEDYVFDCFHRMYESFESRKHLIPKGNLAEISFEELIGETTNTLERVYDELGMGDFAPVRPEIEAYLDTKRNYQRNKHVVNARLQTRILIECRDYIAKYCRRYTAVKRAAA